MIARHPRLVVSQLGFTVVESLLAISVAAIMITVMFSVTFSYYANAMQSQTATEMALSSQTLLSQMVEDLRLADGVSASNQLVDPNAPTDGWQTSDTGNVLVIRYPAINSNRNIIYNPNTGSPYQNEFIYFLSDGNMYKRILKEEAAPDNAATGTCPQAIATASCPADRLFSENVTDLSFDLYDTNNVATSDPLLARSVKITLDLSKTVFGKTVSMSNTTQVTQRNQ